MPDIETVRAWTKVVIVFAAIGVTAFPLLYVFSAVSWYRSPLGRASMLKAVALMISIDFYAVYQYWAFTGNIYFLVWFRLGMYALIGVSGYYMTINLIRYNYWKPREQYVGEDNARYEEAVAQQRSVRSPQVPGSDRAAGPGNAVRRTGGPVGAPEAGGDRGDDHRSGRLPGGSAGSVDS